MLPYVSWILSQFQNASQNLIDACYMFQLHPDALYLLGVVYLTGDCVKKDIASALWCFHRASEKVIYQLIKFKELIFFKTLHCVLSIFFLSIYGQNVFSCFFTCGELEGVQHILCHLFALALKENTLSHLTVLAWDGVFIVL